MGMTATKAIKTYFDQEPHGRRIDAKELLAFKKAHSDAAYQEFGQLCCEQLGESLETSQEA